MKKKAIAGLMLILIVIGLSKLVNDISLVNANLKNIKNQDDKRYSEQTTIFEHRISASELKDLKERFGVLEEGRNYNQIIDGHGTGLSPPTEEEWAEIADNAYVVEKIALNQAPPSSVDHTNKTWFPPIGDQNPEGSCTAFATAYYTKTFQEAKEHDWNLTGAEWLLPEGHPTPEYQDRIMSPDFVYHLVNGGVDEGSSFPGAINLLCGIGACSWEKMPYDPYDSTSWPSEEAWREAPLYRGNSSGFEIMELLSDDDLLSLKNWIASDHMAQIVVDGRKFGMLDSNDVWTLNNYSPPFQLNHAQTVVGYDDNIRYREGTPPQWRYGAFKIANSWGVGGWENVADGCYWISYEAMKQRIGSQYPCVFYRDRTDYDPKLLASFEVDHSKRGECTTYIGVGNYINPLVTKSFSHLVDGGTQAFCANDIVFDVTELEDAVPNILSKSLFMYARTGIPPAHSGTYEWYSDGSAWSWFTLNQNFTIPATGATLKFWSYYEIEEDWDYGYVEVYDMNTSEWYTLPGLLTVSTLPEPQDNPNCPPQREPAAYYGAGRWHAFTGFGGLMYQETMDLTPFATHNITLSFTYWTDPYTLEHGWYIDDIEIPEIGFFDSVESGIDGWTFSGNWARTTPPASYTGGTLLSFSIESYHNYTAGSLKANSTSPDPPLGITNLDAFADVIFGDVDSDGSVDLQDLTEIHQAFGSTLGSGNWDPQCNVYRDDIINLADLYVLGKNYGRTA